MNKDVSKIALSALSAAILTFTGCGESGTNDGGSSSSSSESSSESSSSSTPSLPVVEVREITADTTWTADKVYKLAGNKVKVSNNATLTIQAGTTIFGESQAYLIVLKGSKLMAEGTQSAPIIFTSEAAYNGDTGKAGQWGGVTILGNAQVNEAGLFYEVDEADADFAFGSTGTEGNTENSGSLKYVEIRNSGFAVAPDKEVNGLSLCGIGSGTTIENITITDSEDDGIELWGGTVNLKDISITGAKDDSFDVDNGYTGTVTNLTVVQTEPGAALVEMTNSGDASIVRTNLTIDGFTLTASATQKKEGGLYFKDADTTGTFSNGTINMSASTAADGALHNKKGVFASPTLSGVTVTKSATVTELSTGDASGAAVLDAAFAADETNTIADAAPKEVVEVREIAADTTWTADKVYKLAGNKVKVSNNATLTIQAGTTIFGESQAYLIVLKGSKLMAEGTQSAPIIFTSEAAYNGDTGKAGQWGGVTILGNAQVNEAGLFYEVDEADADFAFGSTGTEGNTENSGSLKYVEIRNSGFAVAPDKEVNGLSLCGIGSGTTIENITITDSEDDGIELWGGTVNLKDISITGAKDDSFDVDNGYTGTVTNLTVVQTEPGAALVEMTNSGDASIVRTNLTIDGFTLTASATQKKEGGLYFKDADTTGTFSNGTINMSASTAADGALHNKKGVFASPTLSGVTVTKSATVTELSTGDASGAAVLDAAFAADETNTQN